MKRIIQNIKQFVISNRCLTKLLVASILIVLSYILSMDIPELFTNADIWFSAASQLSLAYISSFIFYVIVSYIPEIEKKSKHTVIWF